MSDQITAHLNTVLDALPATSCLLASADEERRAGVLLPNLMRCATDPICVAIAPVQGHAVASLLRESRAFSLGFIDPHARTKLFQRTFAFPGSSAASCFDPFPTRTLTTGSPILTASTLALDCELICQFDLEADTELYIGRVLDAYYQGSPQTPLINRRIDRPAPRLSDDQTPQH